MPIKDDLAKIISGEIVDDEQSLTLYSTDASIFKIKPALIVYPKTSEDIKSLIKFVTQNKDQNLSITARSAGTDMSGGAINDSIIMDMTKHFNQIIEIGPDSATTQPGVYYRDFEVETLKKNLLLPCYTASKDLCTVGGMVANNSAGEKTLSFGQTERYVKKLKVIFADGNEYLVKPLDKSELDKKMAQTDFEGEVYQNIYRLITENTKLINQAKPTVSKNSAGYFLWNVYDGQTFDLTKLIVGSQGTLGIVTEIEFKLITPKTADAILLIFLENLDSLDQIINQVLEFKPEAFECYDDQTLKYAIKFLPELLPHFHLNNQLFTYLQFLPDIIDSFLGKIPKLTLIAQFTADSKTEAIKNAEMAKQNLVNFKIKTKIIGSDKKAEKYWVVRHESFNLLRHHAVHMRSAPFMDDLVVAPKELPEFLPKLENIMLKYKDLMLYTIAGHIGDGNFHIIPLLDIKEEKVKQAIVSLSKEVYDLVFEYHGSMTGEHNDGLIRGPLLEQMYGEDVYQLFKEVKEIFDPKNIFNPHKKVQATYEYSYDHFADH